MTSVLALDPAWTPGNPSGVALLESTASGWSCVAMAPSYTDFHNLARGGSFTWGGKPLGGSPNVPQLLADASMLLGGADVDLVTVDMPVAMPPAGAATPHITGRRTADRLISEKFGGLGCAAHSPTEGKPGSPGSGRPGAISTNLRTDFDRAGYPLATSPLPSSITGKWLVEVYPHPALLTLTKAVYRVPYKIDRASRYWRNVVPKRSPADRRALIAQEWVNIGLALLPLIAHTPFLPSVADATTMRTAALKQYEDALDALVCGWVGIEFLAGRCQAYGDHTAAIWVP